MTDVGTDIFNIVYDALVTDFPDIDVADHYVREPSSFPHVQEWEESDTTSRKHMDLSGNECFSNLVQHIEYFDNMLNGKGKDNVNKMVMLVDNAMRLQGYVRTYCAPVPNYQDASIYRVVARYSRVQPNK